MLSNIVKNITPSATCELEGTVADLRRQGLDIISMNVGEPDFQTPKNICEKCIDAINEGKTKYTNVPGIIDLREAIARKLERDNGIVYSTSQICVSTGAKQAINNAVIAITNPGDEIIVPVPCWVSYIEIIKLVGGVPVTVPCLSDYQLDIDAIEAGISDRTKAIIINTPNNPTGAVYTKPSLTKLVKLAAKHDFYIISDEVYEKLIYGGKEHVSPASIGEEGYSHTILVNGMSKAYSMTGWRIGYTAAPQDITAGINAIQGHTTSNSTSFVQWASVEALDNGEESVKDMVVAFQERKDYVYNRLINLEGIRCTNVDGAFYLLPDVSYYYGKSYKDYNINDSFDFCSYILKEANVAIVPGGAFCANNTVRIAYTNSLPNITKGMDRMEKALAQLS